jgi:hypothetical protein
MDERTLVQYVEPLSERTVVNLPLTLKTKLEQELDRNRDRYKLNNKVALSEVQRRAVRVFFLLQESHPDLFLELLDRS